MFNVQQQIKPLESCSAQIIRAIDMVRILHSHIKRLGHKGLVFLPSVKPSGPRTVRVVVLVVVGGAV